MKQETSDLIKDLEEVGIHTIKGWVIMKHYSPTTYSHPKNPAGTEKYVIDFYVVGAHSFGEAIKIFHDSAFPDTRYKRWNIPMEGGITPRESIKDEKEFLKIWVTEYSNNTREWNELLDADIVWGLKGKGTKPFFAKLDAENPFSIVSFLREKFSNAEEAFTERFGYGTGFTMEYKEF